MKVLAINGSPRGERSSTAHMLTPLLEGMKAAGADTELVHLSKLKINHCVGCYLCWTKTPGKCFQQDDMAELLDKYIQSETVILGTPLYHFTMSGLLKDFIERTLPTGEPMLIKSPSIDNTTTHPQRYKNPRALILVSPCGFPEFNHFDPLVAWFRHYAQDAGRKNLGEILRPGGEPLSKEEFQSRFQGYYNILRRAGEEIVKHGEISEEVNKKLGENLFPLSPEEAREQTNKHWTQIIEKYKK